MKITRHQSGAYVLSRDGVVLKAFSTRREAARAAARVVMGQPPCVGCGPVSKSSVPAGARAEAKRGLEWRRQYGRGGTAVGVARARDIARGAELSPSTVKRMVSFFARHEVDKKGKGWSPGEDGYPSNGRIAWALWGGDAGRAWANAQSKSVSKAGEREGHQFRGNQYTGGRKGPQKPKPPPYAKKVKPGSSTAGKQPDAAPTDKPDKPESTTGVVGSAKERVKHLAETRAKNRDARHKRLKNEVVREKEGIFTSYKGDGPLTMENATPEQLAYAQTLRNNVVAGRTVQVSEQGATILIDELAKFGAEEYKKSKADPSYKPKDIDLCRITIKGTNSFCEGNTGRARSQMPQLAGDFYETWPEGHPDAGQKTPAALFAEQHGNDTGTDGKPLMGTDQRTGQRELKAGSAFEEALKAKGIRVTPGVKYKASDLRASQAELNGGKVTGIMGTVLEGVRPGASEEAKAKNKALEAGTIYVSNDGYIIDGHHRWAATVAADFMMDGKPGDLDVNVTVIDLPIEDALYEASWFSQAFGIKGKSAKESVKKMLQKVKALIAKGVNPSEAIVIAKTGDRPGHPFRGNQYTRGIPGRGGVKARPGLAGGPSGSVRHDTSGKPRIASTGKLGHYDVHLGSTKNEPTARIGRIKSEGTYESVSGPQRLWSVKYVDAHGKMQSVPGQHVGHENAAAIAHRNYLRSKRKGTGVVGQSSGKKYSLRRREPVETAFGRTRTQHDVVDQSGRAIGTVVTIQHHNDRNGDRVNKPTEHHAHLGHEDPHIGVNYTKRVGPKAGHSSMEAAAGAIVDAHNARKRGSGGVVGRMESRASKMRAELKRMKIDPKTLDSSSAVEIALNAGLISEDDVMSSPDLATHEVMLWLQEPAGPRTKPVKRVPRKPVARPVAEAKPEPQRAARGKPVKRVGGRKPVTQWRDVSRNKDFLESYETPDGTGYIQGSGSGDYVVGHRPSRADDWTEDFAPTYEAAQRLYETLKRQSAQNARSQRTRPTRRMGPSIKRKKA